MADYICIKVRQCPDWPFGADIIIWNNITSNFPIYLAQGRHFRIRKYIYVYDHGICQCVYLYIYKVRCVYVCMYVWITGTILTITKTKFMVTLLYQAPESLTCFLSLSLELGGLIKAYMKGTNTRKPTIPCERLDHFG